MDDIPLWHSGYSIPGNVVEDREHDGLDLYGSEAYLGIHDLYYKDKK
jgi:hypothetical protein